MKTEYLIGGTLLAASAGLWLWDNHRKKVALSTTTIKQITPTGIPHIGGLGGGDPSKGISQDFIVSTTKDPEIDGKPTGAIYNFPANSIPQLPGLVGKSIAEATPIISQLGGTPVTPGGLTITSGNLAYMLTGAICCSSTGAQLGPHSRYQSGQSVEYNAPFHSSSEQREMERGTAWVEQVQVGKDRWQARGVGDPSSYAAPATSGQYGQPSMSRAPAAPYVPSDPRARVPSMGPAFGGTGAWRARSDTQQPPPSSPQRQEPRAPQERAARAESPVSRRPPSFRR